VLAVAGVVAALAFFSSRDDATTDTPLTVDGPGLAAPAATGAFLRRGNLAVSAPPGQLPAARALAQDVGGPPTADLRAAGQAIVVRPAPAGADVVVQAWRRELRVPAARDPRLREFLEFWLGRGAG
jgi:hypothetical protein